MTVRTITGAMFMVCVAVGAVGAQTAVDKRGDQVMGFSHQKSQHHFRLAPDGGRIEVVATSASDETTIAAIRSHLKDVAVLFEKGEFGQSREIHGRELPGIALMREQRDKIAYAYEDMAQGGRVTMKSSDATVLKAIHEFMRAQIADHRTGDPTTVEGAHPHAHGSHGNHGH
jgi:hypothetical protein